MKKLFLLTITAGLAISSFAQSARFVTGAKVAHTKAMPSTFGYSTARTTANSTDTLFNLTSPDTATLYYALGVDSGFIAGANYYGFNGFAERYDISTVDSPMKVIGILPLFGEAVNPASSNQITLKVWSKSGFAADPFTSTAAYNGLPDILLDSLNVPVTSLGVTATTYGFNPFYFATPTAYLTDSFYVGYTMNYAWGSTNGDTIALATSRYGNRISNPYTVFTLPGGNDTLINNQNAFMLNGQWLDYAFDFGYIVDLYIFPIVVERDSAFSVGVKGITNKNFTFFGAYPNPATTSTNAKFSLASATDVTIQVMDLNNGRVINTINERNQSAGEHVVNVSTADLATGDYLLLIRAANGGGIANKFSVIK